MDGINHGFRYKDCDDGNTIDGDGCSNDGIIEDEWTCMNNENNTSVCRLIYDSKCGDGIVTGTETCDDGNYIDGDGCNMQCEVEIGGVEVKIESTTDKFMIVIICLLVCVIL